MEVDEELATFSAAEAAVYDRQMRLWGVEAQKRIQNSQVLVSGLSALGSELVKNLVLSGMTVTVHDPRAVTQGVVDTQFFFFESDIGNNVSGCCDCIHVAGGDKVDSSVTTTARGSESREGQGAEPARAGALRDRATERALG